MKAQDRYEHKESKTPVVIVQIDEDKTGFNPATVVYRFLCDAGNGFVHSARTPEFLKFYQPGMGEE